MNTTAKREKQVPSLQPLRLGKSHNRPKKISAEKDRKNIKYRIMQKALLQCLRVLQKE